MKRGVNKAGRSVSRGAKKVGRSVSGGAKAVLEYAKGKARKYQGSLAKRKHLIED